jgi:hypothetical protein
VAAIGCAQEFQLVWTARKRDTDPGKPPQFSFTKEQRRVSVFYLYIFDTQMGPGFIKICTYFPYPVKVWVNGHEWAKRQALKAGIGFTALSNGFAACEDPAALQAICDRFGPGTVHVWFERWMAKIPLPLDDADRGAGYWWELSMRQVETSRTLVFDADVRARAFFEALLCENMDLGRPENVELPELQAKARAINSRLLETETVGQGMALVSPVIERITRPTLTGEGRKAPALRFGDLRVQALAGATAAMLFTVTGITNRSLRALMTGLLHRPYSMNQASYDLSRLARNGLIRRTPGRNRYTLTRDGLLFAHFYTKVYDHILRPLMAPDRPNAPPELTAALATLDQLVADHIAGDRVPTAA